MDFNSTVSQFFIWVVASGVIATFVSYVLTQFPAISVGLRQSIQFVVVGMLTALVTGVAQVLPQSILDMRLINFAVMVLSLVTNWAGALFGTFKGTQHLLAKNEAREQLRVKFAMKLIALVIVLPLLLTLLPVANVSAAPEPQPYVYALVQCSGLSVQELQLAEQKFDTWYGWRYGLTTPAQWILSYEARVNEFASTLGCPKVLDNGALTFNAKIYLPWYRFYLTDAPAPQ